MAEVHNYEQSEGVSNKGHLYEIKLAAFFALRLCNAKKNFNLLINAKNFDKWDDVVIILKENGRKELYCFQLKHVTGTTNADLRLDMFEAVPKKTKCICDLNKLFAGYKKIKSFLLTPDIEKLFQGIEMNHVRVILFTNMRGELYIDEEQVKECGELFEAKMERNEEEDNSIESGDKEEDQDQGTKEKVKIDISQIKRKEGTAEEWDEFFQHLQFSGEQVGEEQLDVVIKDELKKYLNVQRDVLLTKICECYIEYIKLWTGGILGGFHTLTEKHVRINLAEVLISLLDIVIPSEETFRLSEKFECSEWNMIVANKYLVMVEQPDEKTLSFIFKAVMQQQIIFEYSLVKRILKDEDVSKTQVVKTLESHGFNLRCYLSKDIKSNIYYFKNTKMLLWKLGIIPIMVKACSTEKTEIISKIFDIGKGENIKIILILEAGRDTFPIEQENISLRYLRDVDNEHADMIYNKTIKVHGQEVILRKLVGTCPSLKTRLTTNDIIQILTDDCTVGNPFRYKYYYISRQIPGIGLSTEILQNRADFLVIYGGDATARSLEFVSDVDVSGCLQHPVGNKLTDSTLVRCRILLLASNDEEACFRIFDEACSLIRKNAHLIKLHLSGDTVLLQWVRTSGKIETVRNYRISSEKLPKEDITSIRGCINILAADLGYGKTKMMLYLARQQQTQRLVVFVTLADHTEYFLNMELENPAKHLRYFFNCKSTQDNKLQYNVFNAYLDEGRILVILDGIDEISSDYKDRVFRFLRAVANLNIKVWITCRICVQEEIENEVGTLAFTLNTFSETEQAEFIRKYDFDEIKTKNILNDKQELLEIPLYLYMLCKSSSGSDDMLSLCESFIQTEIRRFIQKNKFSKPVVKFLTSRLEKFLKRHALRNTFPRELVKNIVREESYQEDFEYFIAEGYMSVGLIRKFSVNNQNLYVFIHKAIGDYITAKFLTEIQRADSKVNLLKHLFNDKLTAVRYLFYKIIFSGEEKNSIYNAILDKDFSTVSKCLKNIHIDDISKDFTPLHLAAQWGRRHYYATRVNSPFIHKRCYRAKEPGTERIVESLLQNSRIQEMINQKDQYLSWTPVQYADHSGSLGILEEFAKIDMFDIHSSQLLSEMPQSTLLYFCIKHHYNNLFNLLVKNQELDLTQQCDESENTFLHAACAYGNLDVVKVLLNNIPARNHTNPLNKKRETPLHVAAYGQVKVVSFFISNSAFLEDVDNKGYTPLHRAVKCGQEEIVKLFINNGADLKTCTRNGYTLLHTAAYCNHVAILDLLLRSQEESANEVDNTGSLPLHTAVEWNSIECMKLLVDKTKDIDKTNKHGQTPLQLAIRNGQLDLVKMLIGHGARTIILDESMEVSPPIAKYLENLELKKFTSRSTVDSGQDFAVKMAALLSLRCCEPDVEETYLVTDSEECQTFSDIVWYRKLKEGNATTYLVQLKHQLNPKNITLAEFQADRGNYSLTTYKEEIDALGYQMKDSTQKKSRLIDFLNNSNVVFAVFTNRNLPVVSYEFLHEIKSTDPFIKPVNTDGAVYKLSLPSPTGHNGHLHDNLYLFANQVSARNIDTVLEDTFRSLTELLQLSQKTLKDYIKAYLMFIGKWTQGKLGGHCFLSRKHIVGFLTDLLLHPYTKISKHDKITRPSYPNKVSESISDALSCNKSLTVVEAKENTRTYLYQDIIRCLETWWNDIPEMKYWTDYISEEDQAKFYRNNQSNRHHLFRIVGNFGRFTLLDLYKCMWKEGEIPLVLEVTSKQDYDNIVTIHKLSEGTLKVVLLNRTGHVFPE